MNPAYPLLLACSMSLFSGKPILVPVHPEISLGKRPSHQLLQAVVQIRNEGAQALRLQPPESEPKSQVRVNYPVELEINPGQMVELPVFLDLRGASGIRELTAFIGTNEARNRQIKVKFRIEAEAKISPSPIRMGIGENMDPIPFVFSALSGQKIKALFIEDPCAPLKIAWEENNGAAHGIVMMDTVKINAARSILGKRETKLVVLTEDGDSDYILINWWVGSVLP